MRDTVIEIIIRLVACTIGALGFSILFYIKPRKLPYAAVGAALTIGIYLVLQAFPFKYQEFLPNLIAALVGAIYCEIVARTTKTPVPVYLTPALITLAPGRLLYYTMSHLVHGNYATGGSFAHPTVQAALGICGGIIGASVVGIFLRLVTNRIRRRRAEKKS